jgi:hypothetical protein
LELLRVGRAFDGSLYNGLFASLRFYNRSLSSYEIAHNLFGNGARDGLVLEFDFIDNGSASLGDLSGEENNGVIITDYHIDAQLLNEMISVSFNRRQENCIRAAQNKQYLRAKRVTSRQVVMNEPNLDVRSR